MNKNDLIHDQTWLGQAKVSHLNCSNYSTLESNDLTVLVNVYMYDEKHNHVMPKNVSKHGSHVKLMNLLLLSKQIHEC